MTCPDCDGAGRIVLFTSAKPCAKCGGTGTVQDGCHGEPTHKVTYKVTFTGIEPGEWSAKVNDATWVSKDAKP